MISLIVCSRNTDVAEQMQRNVSETIGTDYEWIVVDNSDNKYNLFQAYNEGVGRSKGEIMCFMHDDIVFHTYDWGRVVESVMFDNSIGVLGVIGGKFVPENASWWLANCGAGKIIQGIKTERGYFAAVDGKDAETPYEEVAVVDGLWFCMRKDMFSKLKFDEMNFKGFHCYDVDICMQSNAMGKRVVVTPNILIEHLSRGDVKENYYRDLKVFSEKWKDELPLVKGVEMGEDEKIRLNRVVMAYQDVVKKHDAVLKSHAYRLGTLVLRPIKKLKKKC